MTRLARLHIRAAGIRQTLHKLAAGPEPLSPAIRRRILDLSADLARICDEISGEERLIRERP
jgi:hypothetical protein